MQIEDINPAKYNPRLGLQPGDSEYEKIKRSIQEFGFVETLVWNKRTGSLVGGHQRLKVLKELGYTEAKVSVVDLPEEKEKALNLALNKIQGDWDYERLGELLKELEKDIDLALTGFDMEEIEDVFIRFEMPGEIIEDETPDPPKEPTAKLGDLWTLGRHRLLCGDATVAKDMERLMGGKVADMVLTDPPYNVDYTGKTKDALKIKNDKMGDAVFQSFLADAFRCMNTALKSGGSFYVCHAESNGLEFRKALADTELMLKQAIIWVKNLFVMGRQDYQWMHEPILYGWKEGAAHYFVDDRTQVTVIEDIKPNIKKMKKDEMAKLLEEIYSGKLHTTVLRVDRPTVSSLHPTMKPIKLLAKLIGNSSKKNEIILDPFGGSGSTLIACEQLNRVCYMMELDPKYCDVIIERWENFTGRKVERVNE